jgi:hypothetical protein
MTNEPRDRNDVTRDPCPVPRFTGDGPRPTGDRELMRRLLALDFDRRAAAARAELDELLAAVCLRVGSAKVLTATRQAQDASLIRERLLDLMGDFVASGPGPEENQER